VFRVAVARDVGHHGGDIGPGGEDSRNTFQSDAANGDQRFFTDQLLPFADPIKALRIP